MSSLVGEVLVAEDAHTKKSEDHSLLPERHSNVHSAPRHSEQSTIGNDTRILFICLWNDGSAVQKDPVAKKPIVPKYAAFSAATSIPTMHTSKHTITQRARIDLFKNARLIERTISINI
jgi:hypothetical protein